MTKIREPEIVASSPKMLKVLALVDKVALTSSTVLISGESGTGKEIVARCIHCRSPRAGRDFVAVNCAAIPPGLLESILFGHERGSFTGAYSRRLGMFEEANGGTILLDEVSELSGDLQVKLLRVIQEQEVRRVGGREDIKVDTRVITASNMDLRIAVEVGRFRSDLFYRLNVVNIFLPPLRQRIEELEALIGVFVNHLVYGRGLTLKTFSVGAIEELKLRSWPGNVRELENAVERLLVLSEGKEITQDDVKEHVPLSSSVEIRDDAILTIDDIKRIHIVNALVRNQGNKMKTARQLGINVKTLYNLIKALEIPVPRRVITIINPMDLRNE